MGDSSADAIFDIDLSDLDFDIDDFVIASDDVDIVEPDTQTRIMRPRLNTETFTQTVHFQHAEEFVRKLDFKSGKPCRIFAWISGGFIMGDALEALWRVKRVQIRKLYIASLSISYENIDSWAGMMQYCDPPIEQFDLICSAYFYSHNKFDVVPYLYEKLDDGGRRFQVAFGGYHMKIICIETYNGNTIVIHGSANTRSSSNIEQIMIEVNQRDLFDFNAAAIHDIATRFGTINHEVQPMTRKETNDHFRARAAREA